MRSIKKTFTLSGFTLIEILLVSSLLAVVGLAVYQTFSNGVKIWKKASQSVVQEDILISLDKMNQDLQNAIFYSKIPFQADEKHVSFATVILADTHETKGNSQNQYIHQIGRVEYYFDSLKKCLLRRQANYSQALHDKFFKERILVQGIKSLKYTFVYRTGEAFNPKDKENTRIPSFVNVEINFDDGKGVRSVTRAINIPIGS